MPLTEPAGVYRPRHPERTVVYRLFEEHFERYVREYEERYEPREGSLRKVVSTTVEAYLACGRLEGGFARIRCPNCRAEHLLAFSCRTRNFCQSCQAKRSALFAEHVITEILEPVPHRHVVLTIPRVLLLGSVVYREFRRMVERRGVFAVRLGGKVVPEETIQGLLSLVYLAFLVNFVSVLALAAAGVDVLTAISAVAACMFNVGPGLGAVGPAEHYGHLPGFVKWVLSACMIAGRLEFYTTIVILTPAFWRR